MCSKLSFETPFCSKSFCSALIFELLVLLLDIPSYQGDWTGFLENFPWHVYCLSLTNSSIHSALQPLFSLSVAQVFVGFFLTFSTSDFSCSCLGEWHFSLHYAQRKCEFRWQNFCVETGWELNKYLETWITFAALPHTGKDCSSHLQYDGKFSRENVFQTKKIVKNFFILELTVSLLCWSRKRCGKNCFLTSPTSFVVKFNLFQRRIF